jgi:hypothetical protein
MLFRDTSETEIANAQMTIQIDEDITRLQIAVH